MTNLEELKKELEPYKNTLVIDELDGVARLVDVIDDGYDFHWIYESKNTIRESSCVCGWIPLKGYIDDNKYQRLVSIWNLNNNKAI
jgi:hypothetical protein